MDIAGCMQARIGVSNKAYDMTAGARGGVTELAAKQLVDEPMPIDNFRDLEEIGEIGGQNKGIHRGTGSVASTWNSFEVKWCRLLGRSMDLLEVITMNHRSNGLSMHRQAAA